MALDGHPIRDSCTGANLLLTARCLPPRPSLQHLDRESVVARGVGAQVRDDGVIPRPSELAGAQKLILRQVPRQRQHFLVGSLELAAQLVGRCTSRRGARGKLEAFRDL